MSGFSRLKAFDVYRKLPQDLTEPTMSGALVSIISTVFMLILFITEFNEFLKVQTVSEMFIDINRGGDKLRVNIDLYFPNLICDLVSLDAQDIMGSHHVNVAGNDLFKRRIKDGKSIQEIKHADGDTSFSMERAKKALEDGESCQVFGFFEVNKVPGNFHISSHAYQNIIPAFMNQNKLTTIDLSHQINHISFGDDSDLKQIKSKFDKGVLNPLDGKTRTKKETDKDVPLLTQYYINVVPTTYEDLSGKQYYVHQFTSNSNEARTNSFPALYFKYDLSPVTVRFSHKKESFFRFLVQICAIIGGIFTVAGIVDAVVHKSVVNIMKKASMGKLS